MADISETRLRILAEARRKFARSGFYGTSMDSIVKETGLSKGALYWHFQNKEALFRAVMEAEIQEIVRHFIPGTGEMGENPLEFFTRRGEEYLEILWEDEDLRLIWVHLFLESHRGGEKGWELSRFIKGAMTSAFEKLIPVVSSSFPGLEGKEKNLEVGDLVRIVDYCFHGLLVNLGITIELEGAQRYWRFMITRFIEGG
ncbi:MAG: TetR/AcrR family transcriptional regulator, partial [Thermovirgaceae bacterium]